MNFSDFGKRFNGYSGITHLMDDIAEGLSQPGVIMLGGGNPASIPEVSALLQSALDKLQKSGQLLDSLASRRFWKPWLIFSANNMAGISAAGISP